MRRNSLPMLQYPYQRQRELNIELNESEGERRYEIQALARQRVVERFARARWDEWSGTGGCPLGGLLGCSGGLEGNIYRPRGQRLGLRRGYGLGGGGCGRGGKGG